jgi:hypothetical protein
MVSQFVQSGREECRAGQGYGEECKCKPTRMAVTEDPIVGVTAPWEPQPRPGQSVEDIPLSEWVGQALGAASACWSDLQGAGLFDSTRCAAINAALMARVELALQQAIERTMRTAKEEAGPALGLASTRELLEEVGQRGMEAVHDNPDVNTEGLHLANLMVFAFQVFSDEVLNYRPWEKR